MLPKASRPDPTSAATYTISAVRALSAQLDRINVSHTLAGTRVDGQVRAVGLPHACLRQHL